MAIEPFLINPVRRRRVSKSRKRRGISGRKGLPGGLLKSAIKKFGLKKGMKEAWKAFRGGVGIRTRRRVKTRKVRTRARRAKRRNPLGEEIIVVGANPRKRRCNVMARRRRKSVRRKARRHVRRRRRSSMLMNENPRRRVRRHRRRVSKRRRSFFMNENPRRRRRFTNPKRRRSARGRRGGVAVGALDIRKPMNLIMPITTGIVAKVVVDRVPAMLNITSPLPKAGVQLAVAFGGGMLLKRMIGSTNANIWMLIGAISVATDLLNTYVLKGMLTGLGGFSAIPYRPSRALSAFPEEVVAAGEMIYPYEGIVQY